MEKMGVVVMYVDTLSGSSISMLNRFMQEQNEKYMVIKDMFHVKGYGKEYYFMFILGKMIKHNSNIQTLRSSVVMSDIKKAIGKKVDIELDEKALVENRLYLSNISLPVYALLRKCLRLLMDSDVENKYGTFIKFEDPIDINAQCDNRGGYTVFQYYGATCSFPLLGIVPFKEQCLPRKYNYDSVKIN